MAQPLVLPEPPPQQPRYGDAAYWEERYTRHPIAFDWYISWPGLQSIIQRHIPKEARILQVGVGTSRLQEQMVKYCGYQNIVNIDISRVVIKHMAALHAGVDALSYRHGDACGLPEFRDACFDAVLDKGTHDAIMCANHGPQRFADMLREVSRVLRPGGVLMLVTYVEPRTRLRFLQDPAYHWRVEVYCLAKQQQGPGDHLVAPDGMAQEPVPVVKGPFLSTHKEAMDALSTLAGTVHYCYICTKNSGLDGVEDGAPQNSGDAEQQQQQERAARLLSKQDHHLG